MATGSEHNYLGSMAPASPPAGVNTIELREIIRKTQLIRIEVLVLICIAAWFTLHIVGPYRRRSSKQFVKIVVFAAYMMSYSVVGYTIGLMQSYSFSYANSLFGVWAVCLFLVLEGADSLSAYNLNDNDHWKRFFVQQFIQAFWVFWLFIKYALVHRSDFAIQLWAIYIITLLKSGTRIRSFVKASKFFKLCEDTQWVADYMTTEHKYSPGVVPNPVTMQGYHYMVVGENRKSFKVEPPKYLLRHKVDDVNTITVQDIWMCNGGLLSSERLKDICLSMALSKMLRRRFADFDLAESKLRKTHDFVFQGLLSSKDRPSERAFRVVEVELAFVYDFFYTKHYVIYNRSIRLLPSLFMIPFCIWLACPLFKHYRKPNDELNLLDTDGRNSDALVTLVVVVGVAFLEVLQLYSYIASYWCKVALISKYVRDSSWQTNKFIAKIVGLVVGLKVFRSWENKLGQYSLLDHFSHKPLNVLSHVTFDLVPKTRKGQKKDKHIKLSNKVKEQAIDSLIRSSGRLTNGITSLRINQVEQLSWTCTELSSVTHTILVWHIATTLCEHSSKSSTEDYLVASNLSRYCAYLVAFSPDLLPGNMCHSQTIFDALVDEAYSLLKGAKSMQQKYDILIMRDIDLEDDRLITRGARLGRQLILEIQDLELRWKVLSNFWAEMMLYIAPSSKTRTHLEALTRGGEFITHLWVLLTHAGILERDYPAPHNV